MNKKRHATEFQYILWQYFLTQRIKPVDPKDPVAYNLYLKNLTLLHQLSFYAMKECPLPRTAHRAPFTVHLKGADGN